MKQQFSHIKEIYNGWEGNLVEEQLTNINITDSSFANLAAPIHSDSSSFFSPNANKKRTQKPAFGTKATRQLRELSGNKQSDVIAYSRISYANNQKYLDKYQQIQSKSIPFMSSTSRFEQNHFKHPGPGGYCLPEFLNSKKHQKTPNGMRNSFKKWEIRNQITEESNNQRVKSQKKQIQRSILCDLLQESPAYIGSNLSKQSGILRERIRNKQLQTKQKMQRLKQMMKRPQPIKFNPIFGRSQSSQHQQTGTRLEKQKDLTKYHSQKTPTHFDSGKQNKKIDLQKLTSGFLPKVKYSFEREHYQTGSVVKSFKQTFSYHPIFASKNQSLYGSYIDKNQNPGPGFYEKKTKRHVRKESSTVKKFFK